MRVKFEESKQYNIVFFRVKFEESRQWRAVGWPNKQYMNQHLRFKTLIPSSIPYPASQLTSPPKTEQKKPAIHQPPIIQQPKTHSKSQSFIKSFYQDQHQQDTNMQQSGKQGKQEQRNQLYEEEEDREDEPSSSSSDDQQHSSDPKQHKQQKLEPIKLESSEQVGVVSGSQVEKKKRKIRTTITVEKLKQMNKVFEEYKRNPNGQIKLKQISEQLGLGYSTVLHKYKQFKKTNKVKGGALIQSKFQKRKYKKSLEIEHFINKALQSGNFFTANQLATYIKQHFNKDYSRSIISRHLGEMGYSYKNIKNNEEESGDEEEAIDVLVDEEVLVIKRAEVFSKAVVRLIENGDKVLFLQEVHFEFVSDRQQNAGSRKKKESFTVRRLPHASTSDKQNILTLVLVGNQQQISFYRWQKDEFGHNQFYQSLKQIIQTLEMSNPSSEVGKQQKVPEFSDVLVLEDFEQDIFFEQEPVAKKESGRQKILLQKQQERRQEKPKEKSPEQAKQQAAKPPTIQPRFLILSFDECHRDLAHQQQGQTLFELFSSYNIEPLYIPQGWEGKLNMLQLWYKRYLEQLLDKNYKSKKHFTDECQQAVVKHAYDTEECFVKVKQTMEKIAYNFQVRQEYVEKENYELRQSESRYGLAPKQEESYPQSVSEQEQKPKQEPEAIKEQKPANYEPHSSKSRYDPKSKQQEQQPQSDSEQDQKQKKASEAIQQQKPSKAKPHLSKNRYSPKSKQQKPQLVSDGEQEQKPNKELEAIQQQKPSKAKPLSQTHKNISQSKRNKKK